LSRFRDDRLRSIRREPFYGQRIEPAVRTETLDDQIRLLGMEVHTQ